VAPRIVSAARELLAGRAGARLNTEDGLRVDLPEGWVHVRASNTEPIMRITTEADTRAAAEALAGEVRKVADGILAEAGNDN
jgi:phosphomannomutase